MRSFAIVLLISAGLVAMTQAAAACSAANCNGVRSCQNWGKSNASVCACPRGSHWDDNMCKPNDLYCKPGKFATHSCSECYTGTELATSNTLEKYCQNYEWWVWFLYALALLASVFALAMLIYLIFWIAQTYCGCCKQKKAEKKTLIEVPSKPAPRHEIIVEVPRPQANTRVEYGEPRITYGQSTVQEYRDHQPSHMERRHVETRQLSPDRQHEVLYRQDVDWAKESRVREQGNVSYASGQNHGQGRVVYQQPQYVNATNPFGQN